MPGTDRRKLLLIVGVALVLAVVASGAAYRFLSEKSRDAERARLETVGIAVATLDIPMGTEINPNQVALVPWPKDHRPQDAHTVLKDLEGRRTLKEFVRGEPVVESKLMPRDKNAGLLALKVPEGLRAFSVKVNEVVGVGGFIVPDSRVDVVVTTAVSAGRQMDQVSKIVLEDVRVLAAGQVVEHKDSKPVTVSHVTLAVTPEDAERLALASNDGKIQLVLRNYADALKVTTGGIDKGRLLASYRPPAPPAPARVRRVAAKAPAPEPRKAHVVEVIKGSKRSEESFE